MKVQVDPSLCAGFGVCVELSEEVFDLIDEGYAIVKVAEVPPELEEQIRTAVDQCPARAISITEE